MYKSLLVALLPAAFAAPLIQPRDASVIAGKYIVKFKGEVNVEAAVESAKASLAETPDFTYSIFNGFAGTLSDEEVAKLQSNPRVEYVQQDAEVTTLDFTSQSGAPWGLGRISHVEKSNATNATYVYDTSAGEGACAYVVDTGISVNLTEFGGRAIWAANFVGDGSDTDGHGHGTHVAGTIGSASYGVAKKATLLAVKVLDSEGFGSWSQIIAGIDFIATDAPTRDCPKGAVANLSLGGTKNVAVNDAVAAVVASGVFVAVAAGNNNADAATHSPASEPTAFTVAASDETDAKAAFSNYGALVDVWAPGNNVLSVWRDGTPRTISGTSMASPHVAGLAAYLLALEGLTAATVGARIVELSTKGVLTGVPDATVNQLAYNGAKL